MPSGVYIRRPFSEEHKRKLSEATRRRPNGMLGKHHSEETKRKISLSHRNLGELHWAKRPEVRKKMSVCGRGIKRVGSGKYIRSIETRKKLSNSKKGYKSPFWLGGLTEKNISIRNGLDYRLWREAVFKRDNYTCIWCGQIGGKLHADHIKPFALFPELRFAIDNGRTLCEECHKKTDTYLNRWIKKL